MKGIPQFVVHGDADNTVNVSGSRNMVAALKKLNANVTYLEVAGGSHTDVVVPNLEKAFDFLASQKKGAPPAPNNESIRLAIDQDLRSAICNGERSSSD